MMPMAVPIEKRHGQSIATNRGQRTGQRDKASHRSFDLEKFKFLGQVCDFISGSPCAKNASDTPSWTFGLPHFYESPRWNILQYSRGESSHVLVQRRHET
jgi:hypothetical protein